MFFARRSASSGTGRARHRRTSGSTHSIRQPWQPLSASHPALRAAAPVRTEHVDTISGRGPSPAAHVVSDLWPRLAEDGERESPQCWRRPHFDLHRPGHSSPEHRSAWTPIDPRSGMLAHRGAAAHRCIHPRNVYVHSRARSVPRSLPPYPETTPPELLGGAVEGTGAVLIAAGGGRTPSPGLR
jgi:hypothetical protein